MTPLFGTLPILFVSICFFSHVLQAANLDAKLPPKGLLKIGLDYDVAVTTKTEKNKNDEWAHRYLWSSYLKFEGEVKDITDGQLRMIAQSAYLEMEKDMEQYDFEKVEDTGAFKRIPGVMTILAFGKEIILSSSQKGSSGFVSSWPESPVRPALDRCQEYWRTRAPRAPESDPNAGHKNDERCGEVNAFHQYYMIHDEPIYEMDPKMRVTTVQRYPDGRLGIIAPCPPAYQTRMQWGCNLLVNDQKVNYITNAQAQGYSLKKIAGGNPKKGQIKMCAKNQITWYE